MRVAMPHLTDRAALREPSRESMIGRRRILKALGLGGLGLVSGASLTRAARIFAQSSAAFPFEEVSASASGISWVHASGRSPEMYLPETVGAGCAFLDYDNDGWMDIYLVNSGPCDFYAP